MPRTASVWSPDSGCLFSGCSEPSLVPGQFRSLSSPPEEVLGGNVAPAWTGVWRPGICLLLTSLKQVASR